MKLNFEELNRIFREELPNYKNEKQIKINWNQPYINPIGSDRMSSDIFKHLYSSSDTSHPGCSMGELLCGTDTAGEELLRTYFPKGKPDPRMNFYPSAGIDYRDLLYTAQPLATGLGMTELPEVYIHTDYDPNFVSLEPGEVYNDKRTSIRIVASHKLAFTQNVNYFVSSAYATSPEHAHSEPHVRLLDVEVNSNKLGVFRKPVLYFMFENINFVSEVLLRFKIRITYFSKIREGCGFGGCRKCISVIYPFLHAMGVRFALLDHEIHFDRGLHHRLAQKHNLPLHPRFGLWQQGMIENWSGFKVKVFEVMPAETGISTGLTTLLDTIAGERGDHYR